MTTKTKTKPFLTVGDVREEKRNAEALADYNNSLRVRIERDRQEYISARLREHPEIGLLSNGKFYAYVGAERVYVEGYFLNRIIDAIEAAKNATVV